MGPKMLPCGTPNLIWLKEEDTPLTHTNCFLFDKYDEKRL
jgi:hypothetical protein